MSGFLEIGLLSAVGHDKLARTFRARGLLIARAIGQHDVNPGQLCKWTASVIVPHKLGYWQHDVSYRRGGRRVARLRAKRCVLYPNPA